MYLTSEDRKVLAYNTYNQQSFCADDADSVNLVSKLLDRKNMRVVRINDIEATQDFVLWLRSSFSGDIIDESISQCKPIQFPAELCIDKEHVFDLEEYEIKNIFDSIYTVSFYLTDSCSLSCKYCHLYHKQHLFCKSSTKGSELRMEDIGNLLDKLNSSKISNINFLGGDVLSYSFLDQLLEYSISIGLKKSFYIHMDLVLPHQDQIVRMSKRSDIRIVVLCDQFRITELKSIQSFLEQVGIEYRIHCLIEDSTSHDALLASNIEDGVSVYPFYNYKNIRFFEDYVYVDKNDLLETPQSISSIQVNKLVNKYFFGKLIVDVDGSLYTSFNVPNVGHITDEVREVIKRLANNTSLYKKIRCDVNPCKSCVFNAICPPVSNYELVLKKYDLCSLYK